jgi:hypothetical protein
MQHPSPPLNLVVEDLEDLDAPDIWDRLFDLILLQTIGAAVSGAVSIAIGT